MTSTEAGDLLKKLIKQLQGSSNVSDTVNILNILKRDVQVNEAIIRESKAGLTVGKLRTHESKEVSVAAKELVKKWKGEVEKARASSQPAKPQASQKTSVSNSTTVTTPTSSQIKRTAKSDGVKISVGDGTRDRCAELIYDALASDSGAPNDLILQKAKAVEVAVFNDIGSLNAVYKEKMRMLYANLRDKKNPALRESVVSGEIAAEKLAKMSSSDMASDQRKAADAKINQDNFFASLGAEEQQAETEAFQCSRCKQRKCRYRQAQTRSADEPMTTFVTCVNCGNRWKFS